MEAVIGGMGLVGGIRRFIFVNLLSGFRTGCQKGGGDVNKKMNLAQKGPVEGRPPERLMKPVLAEAEPEPGVDYQDPVGVAKDRVQIQLLY